MQKSLIAALLLVFGGALCAQGPAEKPKAAADKKTVAAPAAPASQPEQPASQPKRAAKAETAKAAAARQAEQEAEESVVMIDSKADPETGEPESSAVYSSERDERAAAYGLPSSYGQCKGVINDVGRSILIFENQEDGAVSFVQVNVGRSNVSWRMIERIPRNSD